MEIFFNLGQKFKLSQRLYAGFLLVIAIAIAMTVVAKVQFDELTVKANAITNEELVKLEMLGEIKNNTNSIEGSFRNIILFKNESDKEAEFKRIAQMRAVNVELLSKFKQSMHSQQELELLKAIEDSRQGYVAATNALLEMASKPNTDFSEPIIKVVRPAQTKYFSAIDALIKYTEESMKNSVAKIDSAASMSSSLMLSLALVAAILGLFTAWLVAKSVTRPLQDANDITKQIAAGNLSQKITSSSRDEVGELILALRDMNHSLALIVGNVRNGSEQVAASSSQIATAGVELSTRTEEQAASLEQTASAMEQLSATVKNTNENANQANKLAKTSVTIANNGGHEINKAIAVMKDITSSSAKMADIIATIDGIAFQTNILALNASVEAARAGEQGRGFAVVASEVRSLAQRSANAAKEIKQLIEVNVKNIELGSHQVETAGTNIHEIVAQVTKVGRLIEDISRACAEQSTGITEVASAVNELDRVTQQNAASVEENAAAVENLKDQSHALLHSVSSFKLF